MSWIWFDSARSKSAIQWNKAENKITKRKEIARLWRQTDDDKKMEES